MFRMEAKLAALAECMEDGRCMVCGQNSHTHLFHISDIRMKGQHTGPGQVIATLCAKCRQDAVSGGTEFNLLIDMCQMVRNIDNAPPAFNN